jgi:hypothetical protein
LFDDVVNVPALSAACPANVRLVAPDVVSSTVNCTHAFTMVAPGGIVTFWKRMPMVCAELSSVSSRSELLRSTLVPRCSASSLFADTRRSNVVNPPSVVVVVVEVGVVVVVVVVGPPPPVRNFWWTIGVDAPRSGRTSG